MVLLLFSQKANDHLYKKVAVKSNSGFEKKCVFDMTKMNFFLVYKHRKSNRKKEHYCNATCEGFHDKYTDIQYFLNIF